jgi:hypothetical protein
MKEYMAIGHMQPIQEESGKEEHCFYLHTPVLQELAYNLNSSYF